MKRYFNVLDLSQILTRLSLRVIAQKEQQNLEIPPDMEDRIKRLHKKLTCPNRVRFVHLV